MSQPHLLLVGIDDTDRKGTPGTGRLARQLLDELIGLGCEPAGVTRHQFLIDPRIPYTSHNSAACLALAGSFDLQPLQRNCLSFLQSHSAEGSQPGLCVAWQHEVPQEVTSFGLSAQQRLLHVDQAVSLAERTKLWLKGLTDSAQGIIGALAAVGLRAGGNDGRFIQLARIRQASGLMSVAQIKDLGVHEVLDNQGRTLDNSAKVATLNWIRPRLRNHRAILYVEQDPDDADLWLPADRSKSRRFSSSSKEPIDRSD